MPKNNYQVFGGYPLNAETINDHHQGSRKKRKKKEGYFKAIMLQLASSDSLEVLLSLAL